MKSWAQATAITAVIIGFISGIPGFARAQEIVDENVIIHIPEGPVVVDPRESEPTINPQNLSYVSGGVGASEREDLLQQESNYHVKIVLTDTNGAYATYGRISIHDMAGAEIFTTTTEGPILLVDLPVGEYEMTASVRDESKTQKLTVNAGAYRTLHVRFTAETSDDYAK